MAFQNSPSLIIDIIIKRLLYFFLPIVLKPKPQSPSTLNDFPKHLILNPHSKPDTILSPPKRASKKQVQLNDNQQYLI